LGTSDKFLKGAINSMNNSGIINRMKLEEELKQESE
jgi:hypothetical protein